MRLRPLVPVAAAAAAASLLIASAGPAAAATTTVPAAGDVASLVQLLELDVAGKNIVVGGVTLSSTTIDEILAKVTVTPLEVDGTPYGQQVVTDESDAPVAGMSLGDAAELADLGVLEGAGNVLSGVVGLTGPDLVVSATETADSALTSVGAADLGSLDVLGIDLTLNGTAQAATGATATKSSGAKKVALSELSLPSITDILAALGLDLADLPVGTLTDLFDQLGIVDDVVDQAMATVDSLQDQVAAAQAALEAAEANSPDVTAATAAATAAQAALDAATAALTAEVPGTLLDFLALPAGARALLELANPDLADAFSDYQAALGADALADATLAAAIADAVTALTTLIDDLQGTLQGILDEVDGLIAGVLDDTPLLSLDEFVVETSAVVTSAVAGGQTAKVTGGTISGLNVLGTDILDTVLGSTSVDVVDLGAAQLAQVDALLADLTGTLSSVLTGALPGLGVTAPEITVLDELTETGIADGFGTATAGLAGLKIALPQVTLPAVVPQVLGRQAALLSADELLALPAFAGVSAVDGLLTSNPATVTLLTVAEQSRFRPTVTTVTQTPGTAPVATPTTGTPSLATTGSAASVAGVAALLMVAAAAARRRRPTEV